MTYLDETGKLNTYQILSRVTYREIRTDHAIIYPTLGLVNEAGEVAGKVKKIFRDEGGHITEQDRLAIKGELGDILWYLTQIASNLDLTLAEIADGNLVKIMTRYAKGMIGGSGDHRERGGNEQG